MQLARWFRIWRSRLLSLSSKDELDHGLDREMAFHLDQLVEENIAAGMSPREAREAARRTFGNIPSLAEECRDQRRVGWLLDLLQDIHYGARSLRNNLRFTIAAVASLALGIGANTAMLGSLDATFRGQLPFADSDRLVILRNHTLQNPAQSANSTVPEYLAYQQRLHSYSAIGLSIANRQDMGGDGLAPEHVAGHAVTPSLFAALGVSPILGRTFNEQEGDPSNPARVVVISHKLWQRRFSGSSDILNRSITMDGRAVTVIGVMPPEFWYPNDLPEYWIPLGLTPAQQQFSARLFAVVAKLKAGVAPEQAQAELSAVSSAIAHEHRESRDWRTRVVPVRDQWFSWLRRPLLLLEGSALLVLLIACANVATLLLARATARRPEFAMRLALGASHGRVFRQLLAESLPLSAISGVCAIAVSWGALRLMTTLQAPPGGVPAARLAFGGNAWGLAVLLPLACGVIFGAVPALLGLRKMDAMREGVLGRQSARLSGALSAAQVGIAFVLLVASGILSENLLRVVSEDRGYDPDGLLAVELRIPPQEPISTMALFDQVYQKLRAMPAVETVAGLSAPPMNAILLPTFQVQVEGRPLPQTDAEASSLDAIHLVMTPGYFKTVRAQVVRGRDIDVHDTGSADWVAVINETMARQFWPGEDPIGKRFHLGMGAKEQTRTVVGMVHDIQQLIGEDQKRPFVYTSYQQQQERYSGAYANLYGQMTFLLRGHDDSMALIPEIRRAVAEVDPHHPISSIKPVAWWAGFGIVNRGLSAGVVFGFALVALLLASMGVYSVTAYLVSQRRREIGIHIALGAQLSEIRGMLYLRAAKWAVMGIAGGAVGGLLLARLMGFEIQVRMPGDAVILGFALLVLMLSVLIASFVPARRATEINPSVALRGE